MPGLSNLLREVQELLLRLNLSQQTGEDAHYIQELLIRLSFYQQQTVVSENRDKPTLYAELEEDAKRKVPFEYMDSVQDALGAYSDEYLEFMDLMYSYQNRRKGILATMVRLKKLLKEHQDLLAGFNAYLPVGFNIPIIQPGKDQLKETIDFYNEVQKKLQDDDNIYFSFQTILKEYLHGYKDIPTLKQEINILFSDRPDVNEICCHHIDAFLSLMNRKRSDEETDRSRMSVGSNTEESEITCLMKQECAERDIPLQYIDSVKKALGPCSQECSDFLKLMSNYKAERIGIPEFISGSKMLLKDQYKLFIDLHKYLPKDYQTDLADATELVLKIEICSDYRNVHEKECYVSFLNILKENEENKNTMAAVEKVATLFHDSPDILEEFYSFARIQIPE